jgi:hypothetical protein
MRTTLVKQLFLGSLQGALFADMGGSSDDRSTTRRLPRTIATLVLRRRPSPRRAGCRQAGPVTPVGPLAADFAYSPPRGTTAGYLTLGYIF